MSFDLPRVHVRTDGFDPAIGASCPEVPPELAQRLLELERGGTVPAGPVDRCLPLAALGVQDAHRQWAVGQRRSDDTVWRIVSAGDAERMGGHPAWLWTSEAWFDPALGREARARAPTPTPLRQLARLMAPLGGRNRRTVKTMAAVIAGLRAQRQDAGPVAVVVEKDLLTSASHPARWFVLALLAILPPGRREAMRVSIGETNPDPARFDLVLTPAAPAGFVAIDALEPPDEGDDLVAYYVRNRLNDDDPEALEAASYLFDGEGDRWGDGIAALIRDGLPGVSEVTESMIDTEPDRAVSALAARLRAGAPLDGTMQDQLVRVTLKTLDPRPWRALLRRPPLQRADAVDALLAHAASFRPSGELVTAMAELYPRGAPLDVWVPSLLRWLRDSVDPDAVSDALVTTLSEWPREASAGGHLVDAVQQLVKSGRTERAAIALTSPIALRLLREGLGEPLVALWGSLGGVDPQHIVAFVQPLIGGGPMPSDPEGLAVALYHQVSEHRPLVVALLRAWVSRGTAPRADDPMFLAVRESPYLGDWAEALVEHGVAGPTAAPAGRDDSALGWNQVAGAFGAADDPRAALLSLAQVAGNPPSDGLRQAGSGVHAEALTLLERVLESASFPDLLLSEAAESLARVDGAPPIWGMVAVTAAPPDSFDDGTVDATVVEFCAARLDSAQVALARRAMERLGRAEEWESLDHARWLVRIALGPPGVANVPAVNGLLEGIRARHDGVPFMSGLLAALLDLPPDHEASLLLLERLPETGWAGEPLQQVIERVGRANIPLSLRRTLVAMAESAAGA